MTLPRRYNADEVEPRLAEEWQSGGTYHFDERSEVSIYSIDTPPPTVSGYLHLGHVYSYSHPDFIARYQRMQGRNVFYPMGYDDNGLPTERLVERRFDITAEELGREAFIAKCLEVSRETERDYEHLWQRLGLSIDWRYTYSTIDERSRRISQQSFLDLYAKDLVYRRRAPTIWCPECRTAIAQAEVNDLERESEFVTIAFGTEGGGALPIATTRPELLPACVAVFIHPGDKRYAHLVGHNVQVPLFGHWVPVIEDPEASPEKGTGAVMCCTFGDTADVEWWYTHDLPLKVAIAPDGRMTEMTGAYVGLTVMEARRRIVGDLEQAGLLLKRETVIQTVRVHERDDTPVEYIVTQQWFVRVLDAKDALLRRGDEIAWHPSHMHVRYREWVQNLGWDWCISRQRYYGVTFPVWYCDACGEVVVADPSQLPVDPTATSPPRGCGCGGESFTPEADVMDTWATSSMTPQIVTRWLSDPALNARLYPLTVHPQSHEIIRTWAFYTIVKSHYEFDSIPWRNVLISGWGRAPEGVGKISKSRGGGPMAPLEMIERYSADACRYWAASTGPGKDAVISEEKIAAGQKLVTKLWNVAAFSARFFDGDVAVNGDDGLSLADRWIEGRLQRVVLRATEAFESYDYAAAKNEIENFFWRDLADNYLEMAKKRLYDEEHPGHEAARAVLSRVLMTTLKLFAPILPFVTEEIYRHLVPQEEGPVSIHRSRWPRARDLGSEVPEEEIVAGELLVEIATAARRYKSDNGLSLGAELTRLEVAPRNAALLPMLRGGADDISSVSRARDVAIVEAVDGGLVPVDAGPNLSLALRRDGV